MDPRIQYPQYAGVADQPAAPAYPSQAQASPEIPSMEINAERMAEFRAAAAAAEQADVEKAARVSAEGPTRAEAREMRRREREGVEFWLANTGKAVRVRDLPFADFTMIAGIPPDMRESVALKLQSARGINVSDPDLATSLRLVDVIPDLADAVCLAGFIKPRLVRTEEERRALIVAKGLTDEDVWLVDDLHPAEKEAYRKFVFRNRDGEKEDRARIATFQGAGMAQTPGR